MMHSPKPKKRARKGKVDRALSPHELLKLLHDALRRKRAITINCLAGAHPLEHEVTSIEPGAAPDLSEALIIVDDERTVLIAKI